VWCLDYHRQVGDEEDRDDKEDFVDWSDQLHGFLHEINVVNIRLPPTSDSLPLPFPCILTLAQATDLSEEETSTTDTDIDDYTLAPRSAQAKVNDLPPQSLSVATRSWTTGQPL
jgi:hypothetical protein